MNSGRTGSGPETLTCPFRVNNGPDVTETPLPVYPKQRTLPTRPAMSVSCQTRTSRRLFDQLIGAHEERRRDREAKRFGGPHVDDEVEARGALKR